MNFENEIRDLNETDWTLVGRINALEIVCTTLFAVVAGTDRSSAGKEKAQALINYMRTAAQGHPVDMQTPEGQRAATETAAAMEDLASHLLESLNALWKR